MDPVSIVSLVGASMAIAARVAELVNAVPRLIASYRETERSIRRLGAQLELFQGTMTELGEWLQRSPSVSERVKTTLHSSLISCKDITDDIETHIKKLTPEDGRPLGIASRGRYMWDEGNVAVWEQRVLGQMQMMDIYIRMLHLNNSKEQESILNSKQAIDAIQRGHDDAKTVRSGWEDDSETLPVQAPSSYAGNAPRSTPKPEQKRRSLMTRFKSLSFNKPSRRKLATELVAACRNRNVPRIHELISQGASPDEVAADGTFPLIAAIQTGQFTIVDALLQYGAQVNIVQKGVEGRTTPLVAAIDTGSVVLVKQLIQRGAEVVSKSSTSTPPLFRAIQADNADILSAMLEAGADSEIHTPGPDMATPLMAALEKSSVSVVRVLLDFGADVSQKSLKQDNEMTPLCLSLCRKHNVPELVQLLLERGADAKQVCGNVHLSLVTRVPVEPGKEYETDRITVGMTAVHLAATRTDCHEVLESILRYGGDANARYRVFKHAEDGISDGGSPIIDACDDVVVRTLVKHGADVNDRDEVWAKSALSHAVDDARHLVAIELIKLGATIHQSYDLVGPDRSDFERWKGELPGTGWGSLGSRFTDDDGYYSPGEEAAESYLILLKYLVAAGADVKLKDGSLRLVHMAGYKDEEVLLQPARSSFQWKCNGIIREASGMSAQTRKEKFFRGDKVMGVCRSDGPDPRVKQKATPW